MIELRYFEPKEFTNPDGMDPGFLRKLDQARHIAGVAFHLTSTLRHGDPRSHGRGHAVDIRAHDSGTRFRIVKGLIEAGFTRIGVYDRHVHADDDPELPPFVLWMGTSE